MAIINGTIANDKLLGTLGNDTVIGGGGNDVARMRAGDDVFVWNSGDGSDTVGGASGFDKVRFTFGAGEDLMHIDPNGTRAKFYHNLNGVSGSLISMDLNDIERINLRTLGNSDFVEISDLIGTDIQHVAIDLAGTVGGVVGDGAKDAVIRDGSDGDDTINVALVSGKVSITGLSTQVTIRHADATDGLSIYGGDGNDTLNASQLTAGVMRLGVNGGLGNDKIIGSQGNDDLSGDIGNDTITGEGGVDIALLGAGNDVFVWNAGDDGDFVYGGDGFDTLRFRGSNASESITTFVDAGGALVSRNIGATTVATGEVERLRLRALGGADSIVVNDLTGTAVTWVGVDLAATAGGTLADDKVDRITAVGTVNNDTIAIGWFNGGIVASGMAAALRVTHADATDVLSVIGGDGNDLITAKDLPTGKMSLRLSGAGGGDVITSSAGNDIVRGGAGNDLAYLGAGNDVFVSNAGDGNDNVKGGRGFDAWLFNGTSASDSVSFYAADERVEISFSFLDDVERARVRVGDGADTIVVQDLTGTDLKQVLIDLGGSGTSGDGEQDLVYAHAKDGNDKVTVALSSGAVSVTGLAALVTVAHGDTIDLLNVYGDDGNDSIDASTLPASAVQVAFSGGSGNDIIIGSAAGNTAHGDDGNDTLRGAGGSDNLLGKGRA